MIKVEIYSDGAARGNPNGPGGYGTVLRYQDPKGDWHMKELSQGYVRTTNNRMELMGMIAGFEALLFPCEVDAYSDSTYVITTFQKNRIQKWIRDGWRLSDGNPAKNTDLWKRLLKAIGKNQVTWHWVHGHQGHKWNERCDQLATQAADGYNLIHDTVFEEENPIQE